MTGWLTEHLVLSGAGITGILWILGKFIPKEWQETTAIALCEIIKLPVLALGVTVYGLGVALTGFGQAKLGKQWDRIESFFQTAVFNFYDNFIQEWRKDFKVNLIEWLGSRFAEGLDSDDDNKFKEKKES